MNSRKSLTIDITGIVLAAFVAILVGFIIILFVSDAPFVALRSLLVDPITNQFNFGTVLNKAIPLIFTGLSVAIVFKAGIFSMGTEGQLYIGAFTGALVAVYVHGLPAIVHIPLCLIAAMIGGGLFAVIPGYLKAYLNVDEIVSTLMLNYVATFGVSYFLNNVFKDPNSGGYARMPYIQPSAALGRFIDSFPTHSGLFIAIMAVIVVYFYIFKSKGGYEIRLVGQNKLFTEYGGINSKAIIMKSIVLSGIVAGLAGIVEVLGIHGTLKDSFSNGLGFDGIIIALLARNNPIGVMFASLFYAYIQVGSQLMQLNTNVPRELAVIIQVLLVILISAQAIFNYLKQRSIMKEKKNVAGGAEHVTESA
ncbi:MAG: ABC transporter permease [Tuberibacillus sp.]